MTYENVRRHLDPVRDYFERYKSLEISTPYTGKTETGRPVMIRTNVEFIGAYLRDELMVVMFRFDDKMIDDFYIDYAYDAIRDRMKSLMTRVFPGLSKEEISVYVVDTSGSLCDFDV